MPHFYPSFVQLHICILMYFRNALFSSLIVVFGFSLVLASTPNMLYTNTYTLLIDQLIPVPIFKVHDERREVSNVDHIAKRIEMLVDVANRANLEERKNSETVSS